MQSLDCWTLQLPAGMPSHRCILTTMDAGKWIVNDGVWHVVRRWLPKEEAAHACIAVYIANTLVSGVICRWLLKDEQGLLSKEAVRTCIDGSVWYRLAAEKEKKKVCRDAKILNRNAAF